MNTLKKLSLATGIALTTTAFAFGAIVFTTKSASAVILNGSFENGFNEFDTIGDTSIQSYDFGSSPTLGDSQALITNGDGSATGSQSPSVPAIELDRFLGAPPGTLQQSLGVTEGSAIKQTFTANAGEVLTFDWNFLTNETPQTNNDF